MGYPYHEGGFEVNVVRFEASLETERAPAPIPSMKYNLLLAQMHFEPYIIYGENSGPLFEKAVSLFSNFKATKVLMDGSLSNGEPRCARIKMRMTRSGKFIHRNRFQRRNILLSLSGKMWWWLSINCEGGVAINISVAHQTIIRMDIAQNRSHGC